MVLDMESSDYQDWNELNPHLAIPVPSRHSSSSKDSAPLQHQGLYPAIPLSYKSERFILPGEGEEYDECGKTKVVISCPNGDYPVELKPHRCTRPECPICWPDWCTKTTRRAVEKDEQALILGKECVNKYLKLSSLIVSPPQNDLWEYDSLKKWFSLHWRKLGIEGATSILHLWRYRDPEGNELESVRWRQFEENPERYTRIFSPHFHCLVIGKPIDSEAFYKRTGGIYKKMNVDYNGNHIELEHHDLFNITYYALSHTAISLDCQRKTVDHYGLIRRCRIAEEIVDWEPVMCPTCGMQLQVTYLYDKIVLGENVNGLTEPHFRKVITRLWELVPQRTKQPKQTSLSKRP